MVLPVVQPIARTLSFHGSGTKDIMGEPTWTAAGRTGTAEDCYESVAKLRRHDTVEEKIDSVVGECHSIQNIAKVVVDEKRKTVVEVVH